MQPTPTNEYERSLLANIEKFGWHCTSVTSERGRNSAPFSYTVGFYRSYGQPEFIMFGLEPELSHSILCDVARAVSSGEMFALDQPCDTLIDNYACVFVEVPKSKYGDFVLSALWLNGGDDFPLYQIVWPDEEGRFPWHQDASAEFRRDQPVLGAKT